MASVVVALQGNPRDDSAVDHEAAALAHRTGRALVAVRVVPLSDPRVPRDLGPLSYLGPHRLLPRGDDARLAFAAEAGRQAGIEVHTELIAAADAGRAIADAARRHDAAVILLEPPGGRLRSRLRGQRLARHIRRLASAPVFTVGGLPPEESR
jgi:nucleotide-binding universal stress UspA family protein